MNSSADNDDNLVPLVVVIWLDRIQFPCILPYLLFSEQKLSFSTTTMVYFLTLTLSLSALTPPATTQIEASSLLIAAAVS